jgi:hypothetical protein
MAAPNLQTSTVKYGKVTGTNIGLPITVLVSNPTLSEKTYKVNSIYISNIDSAQSAKVSIDLYRNTNSIRLLDRIDMAIGETLVAMTNETAIYLEEGDSLRCYADVDGVLHIVASYEIYS